MIDSLFLTNPYMEIRERVKGKQFRHKLISFLVQVTGWKRILKLDIIHMRRKKGGAGEGGGAAHNNLKGEGAT